ncbi:MAG: ribonuclease domain-containing protein [Solirubrobacterales bacterium]
MRLRFAPIPPLVALATVLVLLGGCDTVHDAVERQADSGPPVSAQEQRQISLVLASIDSGSPLAEPEDGSVFRNAEGLLPERPRGYYREYTVPTPGSTDRGARRLVIGEGGEVYYTSDHYRSFTQIDPNDIK